jgi:hypothetical protein
MTLINIPQKSYQTNRVLPANGLGTWFGVRTTAGRTGNFVAHPSLIALVRKVGICYGLGREKFQDPDLSL